MVSTENVFYLSAAAVVLVLALEFSFITTTNSPLLLKFWEQIRASIGLFGVVLCCVSPYVLVVLYDLLFVPVKYEKSLVESEDAPANLLKRYKNSGKVPPPYPNGWFYVAMSNKLEKGDVVQVSALGGEYALYRGDDGVPRMVSAFCPHLGANLAVGGIVKDNCIACPFHGWKFDGDNGKVSMNIIIVPHVCLY